ncbi:MAG TPA: hypothetical protein VMY18_05135 [Acidobacteriota bacterium]|nr:hypothetical protein [Acidobacteriota bacterium]
MRIRNILLFALFTLFAVPATAQNPDAIRPWDENASYWKYKGSPVLLAGGSDDDNLFQWPEKQLKTQLDLIKATGANYVRNTMSDRNDKDFELYPFLRLPNGKYDLSQWNPEYWKRFERFLQWTAERDIIVQIEVWDRFDYSREHWTPHPYNPDNNVNYTHEGSGLADEYPEHPYANKQPFFFTTPPQRNNTTVFQFQQRFVNRMLSYSFKHQNVLYCMDNETNGDEKWGRYWATHIKARASEEGIQVFVTEMWDAWDIKSDEHRRTLDHPELYDFVDASQNNHNKGEEHWLNALWMHEYVSSTPRPINTVKTYGADGNKFGHNDQDGVERFLRHILAGFASARFHRPPSGLGLSAKAQSVIKAVRKLESLIHPWELSPQMDLLSHREKNEAYLAANPGKSYCLYFTNGGSVGIRLETGKYELHWIDVNTGNWGETVELVGNGVKTVEAPGEGGWLAAIIRE